MKKHLITSALPYINGVKHLGNMAGSILPADIYTRFLRQQGEDVLYICGTDEHGTPAEIAALENKLDVKEHCLSMHTRQKDIYDKFDIQFDYFGRTSSPQNHQLTREIFLDLHKNGFIEEVEIQQIYSKQDKRYLPDRYITGTCPHCQYERANGDQCDGCGRLIDPVTLINPRSAISGSTELEIRKTKHLNIKLSQLENDIRDWVEATSHNWPTMSSGVAKKWLQEGLKDRCITRDLKWGIQVPLEGYEDKVFYVWFDAPIGYISITKEWAETTDQPDQWQKYWFGGDNVQYVQFMAKDNLPFHSILWPAMLKGTKKGWKLVDIIKGYSWLNYENGKFSTSQNRGVFTDTAVELFPSDYWRYYLTAIAPETDDSNFTFEHFAQTINKDLADILGNFVSRVFSLLKKHVSLSLPESCCTAVLEDSFLKQIYETTNSYQTNLGNLKFRAAQRDMRALWVLGNEYISQEEPWKIIKQDFNKGIQILVNCLYLIRLYAICASPMLPQTARSLFSFLNETRNPENIPLQQALEDTTFDPKVTLNVHHNLFTKITDSQVQELDERFKGNQFTNHLNA